MERKLHIKRLSASEVGQYLFFQQVQRFFYIGAWLGKGDMLHAHVIHTFKLLNYIVRRASDGKCLQVAFAYILV